MTLTTTWSPTGSPVPRKSIEHSIHLDILADEEDGEEFEIPDLSDEPDVLLADEYGNLHMLTLITQDIKVVALQLVFPSSMSSSSFRLRLLIEELPKAAQAPFFGNPFRSRLRRRSHLYVFLHDSWFYEFHQPSLERHPPVSVYRHGGGSMGRKRRRHGKRWNR